MTEQVTIVKDSVPCTPEEIRKQMEKLQAKYALDMENPLIFWKEMGIDFAGGSYCCSVCGHHPSDHGCSSWDNPPEWDTSCNVEGCDCSELQ